MRDPKKAKKKQEKEKENANFYIAAAPYSYEAIYISFLCWHSHHKILKLDDFNGAVTKRFSPQVFRTH